MRIGGLHMCQRSGATGTYICDRHENHLLLEQPLTTCSMTEFNVVISILSMFLLLAKSTMFVMHIFIPGLSSLVHAVLVALYAVSVYNQSRPDMSDINHLSPGMPWYLSKGCDYATAGNRGFCLQARASFGVTIVML